jgi:hypothetical protein
MASQGAQHDPRLKENIDILPGQTYCFSNKFSETLCPKILEPELAYPQSSEKPKTLRIDIPGTVDSMNQGVNESCGKSTPNIIDGTP